MIGFFRKRAADKTDIKALIASSYGLGITKLNILQRCLGVRIFKKRGPLFLARMSDLIKIKFKKEVGIKWKERYEIGRNELKLSGCLRHFRFMHGLPCRGQRTHTNGRTAKRVRGIVRRKFSTRQLDRIRQKKLNHARYLMRREARNASRFRTQANLESKNTHKKKKKPANFRITEAGAKRFKTTLNILKSIRDRKAIKKLARKRHKKYQKPLKNKYKKKTSK